MKTINNTIRITLAMNYFTYGYAFGEDGSYIYYVSMDCYRYMERMGISLDEKIEYKKLDKKFVSYHLFNVTNWFLDESVFNYEIPSELTFNLPDWIEILKNWSSSNNDPYITRLEKLASSLNEIKHIPEPEKIEFFRTIFHQLLPQHTINTVYLTTFFNPILSIYMRGVV